MKKSKKSILRKITHDKEQIICLLIVLFIHTSIKIAPGFLNIGLIIILITYIYSLTIAIYKEHEESFFDRILKFTIFVLINSPLIIYTTVLFFKTFPNILIKIGSASTWIGFAGSIIGGSMTMFAIIFSIQYQNKTEANKTIPFITVDQVGIEKDIEGTFSVTLDKDKNDILIGRIIAIFKIKNHSNFIAKNIKLIKIVTYNYESYTNPNEAIVEINQEYSSKNDLNLEFFYPDSEHDFSFLLEHRNPNDSYKFILEFQIQFFDIFDENNYITTTKFLITRTDNQRILGKDYSRENIIDEIKKGDFSYYEFNIKRISNILSRNK